MQGSIFFEHIKLANQNYFNLPEYIEYYATNLLDDFVTKSLDDRPFATRLMEACYLTGQKQFTEYKSIGDESLMLLSIFEKRIKKMPNNHEYYRSIGVMGYQGAGNSSGQKWLFDEIADNFRKIEDLIKMSQKIMKLNPMA